MVGGSLARLYLTGGLRLEGPQGAVVDADLPGQQGRIAFAALACERRAIAHDELAEIVWDEDPPARWKSALSPLISKLRSTLGTTGLPNAISSIGGAYSFNPPADIWVDLEDALRRLDRAEGALRKSEPRRVVSDATVASAILRRPFLPGVDGLWVDRQRRRKADALFRCSLTLATAWNQLGDHQLAATVAETAIDIDPLRERSHRLLIEAEGARGDLAAALRAYERCRRVLGDELGVTPSEETLALVQRLLGGHRETT